MGAMAATEVKMAYILSAVAVEDMSMFVVLSLA